MDRSQNDESEAADFSRRSQNIGDGCESHACLGILCEPGLICVDVWRHADCRLLLTLTITYLCSTPERIRGEVLTTMRYTNRRLGYLTLPYALTVNRHFQSFPGLGHLACCL